MPSSFKYLFTPKDISEIDLTEVLEISYPTIESLGNKFIVRNSLENRYYVFENINAFEVYFDGVDDDKKCFHEVIIGKRPQRIKFDIDAPESLANKCFNSARESDPDFDASGENIIDSILAEIDNAICDSFYAAYQKIITPNDIITTTSNGIDSGEIKYSYHKVISGYYVESNVEAANYISEYFSKFLRPDFHDLIDFYVYKSIQNFRIVYNHKEGSDRIKMPAVAQQQKALSDVAQQRLLSNCDKALSHFIVQNIEGCVLLPNKSRPETSIIGQTQLTSLDIDKAISLAKSHISSNHTVHKINGGLIMFKRLRPSNCELCSRIHFKDNTLMISVITTNMNNVYLLCRHNKTKKEYLGSFEPDILASDDAGEVKKITKRFAQEKTLDNVIEAGNTIGAISDKFSSLPAERVNIYSSPQLREFEYVDTLCIRAGMKMGKTKKLVEYVNKYFVDTDYYTHNIILVSFRQTFSKEIQNKFKGFTLYNEVSGEIDASRVIIQVESLHRITAGKNRPDLLILDECESIFDQFDSGLHKKFSESWAVFKWLMAYSAHLVCMDANLSNRTYEIISRMRKAANIHYHFDTYQNAVDDVYSLTVNKNEWYLDLYNSLAMGNKIAVAMSSLTEAKILFEGILSKHPTMKIGFYSSKTPMSEKKLHFSNVDEYWGCYDVLIYTPTVSAGISFEKAHYDKLYAYFTDNSCHAEVCIQMLGRIRNVKTKNYVVCIDSTRRNLPVDVVSIREAILDSRSNLFKEIGDAPLTFEYDANGRVKFYENDYFHVWLENTRIKNLSKNNFIQRFVYLISAVGPKITKLVIKADITDINAIDIENFEIKTQIKDKEADLIVNAPELTTSEITTVMNKFIDSGTTDVKDLSDKERYGFEKFRLRRDYQWGGKIDKKFVQDYNNPKNRKIFKNLVKICEGSETMQDALSKIQTEERVNYEIALDSEEKYLQDIKRKYVFDQHWLAVEMLRICGITSLRDTSWRSQYDLKKSFIENEKKMYDALMNLYKNTTDEQIKKPMLYAFTYSESKNARDYVNGILSHINKILATMYGVKITSSRSDPDMYKLHPNKQFDLVSECAGDVPCVNAKWRPVDDTGDVIASTAPYKYIA